MDRKIVRNEKAPNPSGAYSQAVRAGELMFISGQFGKDPKTGLAPQGIEAQTEQALSNISSILEAEGGTLGNALRIGVYLKDIHDWAAMNQAYSKFFSSHYPARTVIQAALHGDYLIEIDCIALVQSR